MLHMYTGENKLPLRKGIRFEVEIKSNNLMTIAYQGDSKMSTTQRVRYLDLYRSKLHKELDQMQYGRVESDLPVATVSQPRRPVSAWAAAVAVLLIGSIAISQAL